MTESIENRKQHSGRQYNLSSPNHPRPMMMMMMIMMMMLIKSINPFALMFSGGRERVHWEQKGYVLIPATTIPGCSHHFKLQQNCPYGVVTTTIPWRHYYMVLLLFPKLFWLKMWSVALKRTAEATLKILLIPLKCTSSSFICDEVN